MPIGSLVTALLLPFAHSRVPVPLFRPRVRDFCIIVLGLDGVAAQSGAKVVGQSGLAVACPTGLRFGQILNQNPLTV